MVEQILHDKWLMHSSDSEHIIPASVPGSVYADLLAAGEMEDPYYRDNELEALKIMNKDYVYETSFEVQEEILRNDRVVLRFDGIDTVADIYLNGHYLAYVDNMHRIWEFQVKQLLCTGINNLKVYLHSPTRFIGIPKRSKSTLHVWLGLGNPLTRCRNLAGRKASGLFACSY